MMGATGCPLTIGTGRDAGAAMAAAAASAPPSSQSSGQFGQVTPAGSSMGAADAVATRKATAKKNFI